MKALVAQNDLKKKIGSAKRQRDQNFKFDINLGGKDEPKILNSPNIKLQFRGKS